MNKKIIWGIVIAVIVIVGIYVVNKYSYQCIDDCNGYTRVLENNPQPSVNPNMVGQDGPRSDWKMYTNTQYGFSFQYPSNWSVCDNKNPDVEYVRVSGNCATSQTNSADYFMVRNIGDLDLSNLQSGGLKADSGWDTFTGNDQMRSVYYQAKNINTVSVITNVSSKNILYNVQLTFKFTSPTALAPITITSPNGGETITSGHAYPITWKNNNAPLKINILLERYDENNNLHVSTNIAQAIENTGMYNWNTIALDPGLKNKIRITGASGTGTPKPEDSSDNYFTITN